MTQANERSATLSELVAEEIRALMARRRMSGRQLSGLLGVSPSWVSYRLTGTQPIDLNDLNLIAGALEVGVHELLPSPEVVARARGEGIRKPYSDLAERPKRDVVQPTPDHPAVTTRRDPTRPRTSIDPAARRPRALRPPGRPLAA